VAVLLIRDDAQKSIAATSDPAVIEAALRALCRRAREPRAVESLTAKQTEPTRESRPTCP